MSAYCLFDAATQRLMGQNEAFGGLFGHRSTALAAVKVADLVVTPAEISTRIPRSVGAETTGRTLWRRADGSQFIADFSMAMHLVGPLPVVGLVVQTGLGSDWGTSKASLAAIEDEVASQTSVPAHLKAAMRERIARSARQQTALLRLASAEERSFEELARTLLSVDSETLGVARVSYWRIGAGGDSIVCEALYDARKAAFEKGTELHARDFPRYFTALVTGTLIPAHDAITDPRTSEFAEPYLKPLGIGAMLDIPVFMRGELVGVVCHEHVGGARGWTMDEQQFALAIGQMFSLALAAESRQEAVNSLRQRDTLLQEANATLERALRPGDGPLTGRRIGRYELEQMIGRGGMGEVYRATRTEDSVAVAVKVMRKSSREKPEHLQRFLREARVTSMVPSEHIARVLETGTYDGSAPYIVMELLEGHDLGWHLRRTPQLSPDLVLELCDHTARALATVRDAGVVHRDLKPANIFLVDALPRRWKLVDFGLAHSATEPLKRGIDENIAGTPQYMAPEQICGEAGDHRTDLYSLAAIAFRALTGRPAFVGDVQSVLVSVLKEPLPPVTSLVRGLPVDVDLVFAVALAKAPDDRFQRVEDFAKALRDALGGALEEQLRQRGWRLIKANTG
ncbi:MAG: protein kinase [Polyangiaceae bacterium]